MALHIDDLPTDPTDIESSATDFVNELGVEQAADVIMILGQLDPTEVKDGEPRWTAEQMQLIASAGRRVESWKD